MKRLVNLQYLNKRLNTAFGTMLFNQDGEVEVEDDVAEAMATIPGFTVLDCAEAQENDQDDSDQETDQGEPEAEDSIQQDDTDGDESEDKVDPVEDGADEPDESEDEETEDEAALNKLTVPELRKIAVNKGLDVRGLSKKKEFISILTK